MIVKYLQNSNPRGDIQGGIAQANAGVSATTVIPPSNDYCYCAVECEYIELAFADLISNDGYKNDTSSFLFNRVTAGGIVTFELYKSDTKIADLNNNDYGVYYPIFSSQPFYAGFVIDWRKVAIGFGFGKYQLKAQITILGQSYVYESRKFRLLPFSDEAANNTVKLTAYQSGNIVGSDLDYSDLIDGGWVESYRLQGIFGFKEHELIQDSYQNSDYTTRQIRDEVVRSYKVETKLLPSQVANWLTENASLSNYLEVTDYNIFNTEIYRDLPVRISGFGEIETYLQKRSNRYVIDFVDRKPNLIKRNF